MTSEFAPKSGERVLGWLGVASIAVVVSAWVGLVLHYEYQVVWLGNYVITEDALFLLGVVGVILTRSIQHWGVDRVASVALRLAFSAMVLAVALVIAEFGTRFALRRAIAQPQPSISLNSLQFREHEIGPKDPARYRIAIVGDSFTFGNGIEENERYSNLLQEYLGPRFEVLNFGYPGNNIPDHQNVLDRALKYSPDFVLLQLYENDFETSSMMGHRPKDFPLLPEGLDGEISRSSVLYRLSVTHWNQFQEAMGLAEGYTGYMARHLRNPDAPDAHEGIVLLEQFIERARAAGVASGGVFFPALYGLNPKGANYPFDYLNGRVEMIYRVEQAPYLDLLPTFLTVHDPKTLWVSLFDAHPNAKGNRLAAIAILNKFRPVWHR